MFRKFTVDHGSEIKSKCEIRLKPKLSKEIKSFLQIEFSKRRVCALG